MKSNEAISVTKDSLGLILQNVKNKIAQKQIIQKKLTPFLFHHVTAKSLMKNFEGMVKEEQKNSMIKQNNDQEPNKIKKDNFNPKDIKISNKKDRLQKYSSIQIKNGKTPRKRFYSALQTTRQKMKDNNFIEKRPSTSVTKNNSNQEQPKLYSHQKSTNTNTNIQTNKKLFQKVLSNQQLTFRTISSRRLSKKQNYFVKLKEKDTQIQVNPYQSIQQKTRQQKIKKQIEKQILLQEQALKSQRIIKLKEKFHQKFQNSNNINFDFDGNLIDLKNQLQQSSLKDILQKNDQKFTKSLKTHFLQSNKKDVQSQSQKIKNNEEPIFFIQTNFKIKQNLRVLDKQTNSSKKSDHSFDKQTINIFQSPQISYRNSLIKNLNSERKVRKLEKNNSSIFINDNYQQGKTSKNYSLLRSSIKNGSFFSSRQQQNEKDEIQQNSSTEYVLNQKDFNNDNRRQISTIPYLQIEQGICYKQQMNLKPQKDESLVQYATISKQMSLQEKESNKTLTGNRTFRSYLSFKKSQHKPIETFNRTFHSLNDKNKSVQSARIMSNIKTLNQHTSNIKNSIKIYSARNPLIEDLYDFLEEANKQQNNFTMVQPRIKNNLFQNQSNKHPFQKNEDLKKIKINKTQNILDHKAKLIMKQKIQRNLFQTQQIK